MRCRWLLTMVMIHPVFAALLEKHLTNEHHLPGKLTNFS